jgi:hypothetical protein
MGLLFFFGFLLFLFAEPLCGLFAPSWLARLAFRPLGPPKVVPLDRATLDTLAPARLSPGSGYRGQAARQVDLRSLRVEPSLLDGTFSTRAELDRGTILVWKKPLFGSSEVPSYARIDLAIRGDVLVASARYTPTPMVVFLLAGIMAATGLGIILGSLWQGLSHLNNAAVGLLFVTISSVVIWKVVRQPRSAINLGVEAVVAGLFGPQGGARNKADQRPLTQGASPPRAAEQTPRLRVGPAGNEAKVRVRVAGLESEGDEATEVDPAQEAVRRSWLEH